MRSSAAVIRLRGVRQNNLKNLDLDLPLRRLVVITGLSGSGKSSLAFDTLFAEGQRRYIETFSPYARQFFDRMDKPQADRIEGIPPAIAIEQRNAVRTTRSTVGTMTEICDYLKVLWPHLAPLHCRQCGRVVRKDTPALVWEAVSGHLAGQDVLVTFDLPLSERLALGETLALVAKQGYQRLWLGGSVVRIEEAAPRLAASPPAGLTVLQDRLRVRPEHRSRFVEACEQAYHFGKGRLRILPWASADSATAAAPARPWRFSRHLHCADCDLEYREPTAALFSFNHPLGACPTCRGFGRIIQIDYRLAVPDRSRTLAQGVVKPWQSGLSAECQDDLLRFCRKRGVPTNLPFEQLEPHWQTWVIDGDPDYGTDSAHEWPHAWYGVKGYFRWLESKAYKMHVRVLLSRYRSYQPCPACEGRRLQPDALLYLAPWTGAPRGDAGDAEAASASPPVLRLSLSDFYQLPLRDALRFIEDAGTRAGFGAHEPLGTVLAEVRARLGYLVAVGLGYLTLDRPTRTLSGGETERVNLTTCLGTRLVNTLFVLDEPSVGLHPRDTARLVRLLEQLRDAGNSVVVVEHEASVMRAADQIIDLGPGHGESGGQLVFQGPYAGLLATSESLTGQYLSGRRAIPIPPRRPTSGAVSGDRLVLQHAQRHNLEDVTVAIPLQRFVCVTGVSGSGKTTLIKEVLLPALEARLKTQPVRPPQGGPSPAADADATDGAEDRDRLAPETDPAATVALDGWESLDAVVLVDQTPLGKTPRSTPALYLGAFDDLRQLFAHSEAARQRGLTASAFSFNSAAGQCERCRGAGFEKVEMQFLSDVFIRCPECDGRRYRPHILEVTLPFAPRDAHAPPHPRAATARANGRRLRKRSTPPRAWSIGDLLEATVDEALTFLAQHADSVFAGSAATALEVLREVGLGYLRLGQPINTLSGGESQRLKLAAHLALAHRRAPPVRADPAAPAAQPLNSRGILFLFDEPTTGLHFEDVRVLLEVFQGLVNAGHSVIVIEHNLEVIKCADWVIDLGPDAGDEGGRVVVEGTPEAVAADPASHTGRALAELGVGRARRFEAEGVTDPNGHAPRSPETSPALKAPVRGSRSTRRD